jgi:hypothetical protein
MTKSTKEQRAAWRNSPEGREKIAAWRAANAAKVQAQAAAWRASPEGKAAREAYTDKRRLGALVSELEQRGDRLQFPVSVAPEELLSLMSQTSCPTCLETFKRGTRLHPTPSIKDVAKGFVPGNIIMLCKGCEAVRGTRDPAYFERMAALR